LFCKTGVSVPDREAVEACIIAGMKVSAITDHVDEAEPATIMQNAGGILALINGMKILLRTTVMAELSNYKFMKTKPLSTDPLHFWRLK